MHRLGHETWETDRDWCLAQFADFYDGGFEAFGSAGPDPEQLLEAHLWFLMDCPLPDGQTPLWRMGQAVTGLALELLARSELRAWRIQAVSRIGEREAGRASQGDAPLEARAAGGDDGRARADRRARAQASGVAAQRIENPLSPCGGSSLVSTRSTLACDGPVSQNLSSRSTPSAGPSSTPSTPPSGRLQTQPLTPWACARSRIEWRKNTPCTRPWTITRRRMKSELIGRFCQPTFPSAARAILSLR